MIKHPGKKILECKVRFDSSDNSYILTHKSEVVMKVLGCGVRNSNPELYFESTMQVEGIIKLLLNIKMC